MNQFTEVLKIVGAVLGLLAFVWNVWTFLRSYLVLGLELRKPDVGDVIVKMTVANSGVTSKVISYAALLVSPENLSLADAVGNLLGQASLGPPASRNQPNALTRLFRGGGDKRRCSQGCILIPLKELFNEQAMVGPGESISHACSLHASGLMPNTTYIVRFLVFVSYVRIFIRWRFTTDALRISPSETVN